MNTYYDFKNDELIAVDIETKDPELKKKGPGVYRKDGYIVGVALSNGELSEYYPLWHPDVTEKIRKTNLLYIEDQLSGHNRKVFANCQYDIDWLQNFQHISVNGVWEDIQVAEPVLNEYRPSYSLDALSNLYLNESKSRSTLREYCQSHGYKLKSLTDSGVNHIWRMPSNVAGQYGKEDVRLTHKIFKLQEKKLKEENLWDIYRLEMDVVPLLLQMRKTGVRIDRELLNNTDIKLTELSYKLHDELIDLAGFKINPNSASDLHQAFLKFDLPITYKEPTAKMRSAGKKTGNPTFDKNTLKGIAHPLTENVLALRHIKTLSSLFIKQYPELLVIDRLHCSFHPLRSDDYGTVSGRFSSSSPNLQQVSSKEEENFLSKYTDTLSGQVIRKLFIPEEDHYWAKLDWSQIEYRLIAHYALGVGADVIRKRYQQDPNVDYHQELCEMTGIADRKLIKTLNFGAAYGMGVESMAKMYGWDLDEAREIYNNYHSKVPFVKTTSHRVAAKAKKTGYVLTKLGRRARLPESKKDYVMFNRLIQGSAADLMKKAMVDAYKAGVYNVLHPHITVHDELDQSVPRTKEGEEALIELKNIMENCVALKVPVKADLEVGENWGELR